MGSTRIFEVGAARRKGGGHRRKAGQTKIVLIGLLTEEN